MSTFPEQIDTEAQLEAILTKPDDKLAAFFRRLEGDLLILGAGGKMGGTLALLAKNACIQGGVKKTIFAASRFSDAAKKDQLERSGVKTLTCELLDPEQVAGLPACQNVIFMAGRKFGTEGSESDTWAGNTVVPVFTAQRFRKSRIVVFSTGCVYPLVSAQSGGCTETTPPAPIGEYAQSCLGRERVFEYHSGRYGTPICLLRLNYSVDLRYGVLHDIALRVWNGRPVDTAVPNANVIWQGDAARHALEALELCDVPPFILNLTGPETFSVVAAAREMGRIMAKPVTFIGDDDGIKRGYLSDASRSIEYFGYPSVPLQTMIRWTAHWVRQGGISLGKPTHFEVNNGKY